MALTTTQLDGILPLLAQGKVRDIYTVDDNSLLFVATDRISAYDVIMANGIQDKGKILTQLSVFWFNLLKDDIRNHIIASTDDEIFKLLPKELSAEKYRSQLEGRSLIVRKHQLIPLEAIVRGYITGSAWKEYKKTGTVHGLTMPEGLQESDPFPQGAIFTPSTKAEQGEHDENISPEKAADIVGQKVADMVNSKAVKLYEKARDYAKTKGIILADTKFEFGIDGEELVLVDEVLTPDSSRFWNGATYEVGKSQDSYDKQFLRDWLTSTGVAGKDGVSMPEDIVSQTSAKYVEAYEALTGKKWVA